MLGGLSSFQASAAAASVQTWGITFLSIDLKTIEHSRNDHNSRLNVVYYANFVIPKEHGWSKQKRLKTLIISLASVLRTSFSHQLVVSTSFRVDGFSEK